ncbi:UNVERIFIED_CONTAM: hypothetical protein PYX00_001204 [Menopon gallinae]|uniref:Uncharacterized protein n=1 Tax=Menopon gallinae TaxID=328185 RepID=A0AAW2IBW1_9NEOP
MSKCKRRTEVSVLGTTRKSPTGSESISSCSSLFSRNEKVDPLERKYREYELEYSCYLARKLQSKMVCDKEREEEPAKKCLVALKKEYEGLLEENVRLYEHAKKMECYGKSIENLDEQLTVARALLQTLTENRADVAFLKVARDLEDAVNRLHLDGLQKRDFDEAFAKNLLGFDSDLYRLLTRMKEYAAENRTLLPEIVREIKEIEALHSENEELKKRCCEIGERRRRKSVVDNYHKYYEMAVRDCKDVLKELRCWRKIDGVPEALEDSGASLADGSGDFTAPCSSSTPHG